MFARRTGCWIAALGLAATGGCQSVGAFIYATAGPLPVSAQYKLPDRPTLIVVEDAEHFGQNELDGDILAKSLTDALTENHAATVVASEKLQRLRDSDTAHYRTLSISDLARLTGASQVVYVDLQNASSGIESTGAAAQAHASARVRVVEASTGINVWPADERLGVPISAELQFNQTDEDRVVEQHAQLLDKLSTNIGRLFYSYQPDDDSGHESRFDTTDGKPDVQKDM